jgi:hypothetical protein
MSIETSGNRQCYTASCWPVASSAIDATHIQVAHMIEVDAKTLQGRKRFKRARVYVLMTNRADGTFFICELLGVTAGAGSMARGARQVGPGRTAFAPVT